MEAQKLQLAVLVLFFWLWNFDILGSSLCDSELVPTIKHTLVLRFRDEGLLCLLRSRGQKVM